MKYIKPFLLFFLVIVLSSFTLGGDLEPSGIMWLSFDDADTLGNISIDSTKFDNGTISGATTGVSGVLRQAYSFTTDSVQVNDSVNNSFSNSFSISVWVKTTGSTTSRIIAKDDGVGRNYLVSMYNNRVRFGVFSSNAATYIDCGTAINTGNWTHIVAIKNGTKGKVWVNGVSDGTTSIFPATMDDDSTGLGIGGKASPGTGQDWVGSIDEVAMWDDRVLNQDDVDDLYNGGNGYNPYYMNITPSANYTESTFITKQENVVALNLNNVNFTILTDSFYSNESRPFYGDVSIQMQSNKDTEVKCHILANGTSIAYGRRTNLANTFGSLNFATGVSNVSIGENTLELVCSKNGVGILYIDYSNGLAHIADSNLIYYSDLITNFSLTMNNQSLRTDNITAPYDGYAVIEWNNAIANNNPKQVITSQLITSKGSCGIFPRTIETSFVASTGGGCAFKVNSGENFTAGLYLTGTNFNIDHYPKLKFLSSPVNYSVINYNNVNTTPKLLGNYLLDNSENYAKLFLKSGISINDSGQNFNLFFSVDGVNTTAIPKTASSNTEVLISQELLDVSLGSINISLYGYSDSGIVNIAGGDFLSYLTNEFETNTSVFSVRSFDIWDNSSINNFTVNLGGFNISTTSGVVDVFTLKDFINFSVYNPNYFSTYIYDHNTSLNKSVNLNQTNINWNCLEKITNNNLNCSSPLESKIFNYNVAGNPYTQSLNVSGYYESFVTFNVTPLQSQTLLADEFFSTNLTLNSTSSYGAVTSCTYNITGITYPSYFESVSGSPIGWVGLINGTYNIIADCNNFTKRVQNITIFNQTQTIKFTMYTANSISFRFYDLNNLSLITNPVFINLVGNTTTYNFNSTNGTKYVDLLNDDTYKITIKSTNYTDTILFATISNKNHLDIDVYLQNGNKIDFVVQDERRVLLADSILTFTQLINGSYVTIAQAKTDFSGRTSVYLNESIEYKFFVVKAGYNTFTGNVIPTQSEYTIIMSAFTDSRFVSIFEDLKLTTTFDYTPPNTNAIARLILNSPNGNLEYYGMNTSYNGVNYSVNVSGFPAGGIETFNITGVNSSIQDYIIITYWFKYNNRTLQYWNTTYYISGVVPTNITLDYGLFDDLENLDNREPMKGIIGAIIILSLVLIFSFSRNLTVTSLGGLIGLGINWKYDLMPNELLVVAMVVIGILIIADNIGGAK